MENVLLLYFYTPPLVCGQTHGPEPTAMELWACPPTSSTPSSSLVQSRDWTRLDERQCSRNMVWTMSRRGGFWKRRRTSAKV
eukprot:630878-Prorocentrum_minimum.AAC.1